MAGGQGGWRIARRLGAVMSEAIVHQYGRDEFAARLARPFWFNFGAVMGWLAFLGIWRADQRPGYRRSRMSLIHVCGGVQHSRLAARAYRNQGLSGIDGAALAGAPARRQSGTPPRIFDLILRVHCTNGGQWVVVHGG